MLHVCYNNEKKIGVKPGDSRNETGQQPERNRATTGMMASSLETFFGHYMVTTRSLQSAFQIRFRFATFRIFHEWFKFRADTRIILVTYDSVSLRFEFSFWLKFRNDTRIISVTYAAWLRSRFGFATFRI